MRTHVALLRGINVGGSNKVPMARLREVMESLGHSDVATYIQSGNVLFTPAGPGAAGRSASPGATGRSATSPGTTGPDTGALATGMQEAIAAAFGFRPRVVVLSRGELAAAIEANPYPGEPNPKCLHAVFLPAVPSPQETQALAAAAERAAARGDQDDLAVVGRTVYLHTPGGFGRSDLAARLLGRPTGPVATGTARNWATVTKLLALCDA